MLYRVIKNAAGDGKQTLTLNVDAPESTSSPTFYVTGDVTKGAAVSINNEAGVFPMRMMQIQKYI